VFKELFTRDRRRQVAMATACVVPRARRCVQCGICSFNCPIGIDVRSHAWRGVPLTSSRCLTCGECVARCPRGVLTLQRSKPVTSA
jgi:ferredoxin